MDRKQFLRALDKWCTDNDKSSRFSSSEGKGSHGTVYVTDAEGVTRKTIVKKGKLTRDYRNVVLKQLGLDKDIV